MSSADHAKPKAVVLHGFVTKVCFEGGYVFVEEEKEGKSCFIGKMVWQAAGLADYPLMGDYIFAKAVWVAAKQNYKYDPPPPFPVPPSLPCTFLSRPPSTFFGQVVVVGVTAQQKQQQQHQQKQKQKQLLCACFIRVRVCDVHLLAHCRLH